jgi:hypothetical protein
VADPPIDLVAISEIGAAGQKSEPSDSGLPSLSYLTPLDPNMAPGGT